MTNHTTSTPISLKKMQITDPFWKAKMELVRTEVIPYQWEALNDRIEGAAPSFCMRNFALAGELNRKRLEQGSHYQEVIHPTNQFEKLPKSMEEMEPCFYGFLFQDSDFYKWIEAVAYSLTQHPDPALEQIADDAIELVCAASQPNGYLNTFYTINNPSEAFTNLASNHELYCFGHLTEGAIAYYEATGKKALLQAATKFADYIATLFGTEDGKLKGYPGHEIAEMALARLYEVTGNETYLTLGKFFIDERGKKPYYYDLEAGKKDFPSESLRYEYQQAHLPVREQKEAVGHAVRAVYLYSGMADFGRITGDKSLIDACHILWENITQKKMYITGGIGSTNVGEAFSYDYDLPNDTAYGETCASIGLVFFARRMLELDLDSRYGDVMERALYNGILSGMAEDGKSFFYTNPLSVDPKACKQDERLSHVKTIRQKWFGCACCPPNISRLISSLGSYAFTEREDTLFVHLYLGATIEKNCNGKKITFEIESGLPFTGDVTIKIHNPNHIPFTLALRIPNWCHEYSVQAVSATQKLENGYLYLTKTWDLEDQISLVFPMESKRIRSNPLVKDNLGKTAIMRGPIVYCLEEIDNGKNLHLLSLSKEETLHTNFLDSNENTLPFIQATGNRLLLSDTESSLYSDFPKDIKQMTLTWVPYFSWANRGEGEMQVWISEK